MRRKLHLMSFRLIPTPQPAAISTLCMIIQGTGLQLWRKCLCFWIIMRNQLRHMMGILVGRQELPRAAQLPRATSNLIQSFLRQQNTLEGMGENQQTHEAAANNAVIKTFCFGFLPDHLKRNSDTLNVNHDVVACHSRNSKSDRLTLNSIRLSAHHPRRHNHEPCADAVTSHQRWPVY